MNEQDFCYRIELLEERISGKIQEAATEAANKAISETFIRLGISIDDPVESQRDFSEMREFVAAVRDIKRKSVLTAMGIIISGLLAALWVGFRILFHDKM